MQTKWFGVDGEVLLNTWANESRAEAWITIFIFGSMFYTFNGFRFRYCCPRKIWIWKMQMNTRIRLVARQQLSFLFHYYYHYHLLPMNLTNVWIILILIEPLNMRTTKLFHFNCCHCQFFFVLMILMRFIELDLRRHRIRPVGEAHFYIVKFG